VKGIVFNLLEEAVSRQYGEHVRGDVILTVDLDGNRLVD
jgi:hypothetical protein